MAINQIRPDREIREVLRRAHPYREFGTGEYERLMRYLTGDYEGLAERNVYPKVWRDANDPPDGEHHHEEYPVGETLVGKRGRLARVIYMTNVGTIPDSFGCDVVTRDGEAVGTLDENYLDTLAPGDVFALGGERFAFRYRRGSQRCTSTGPASARRSPRGTPSGSRCRPIWRRRCSRFRPTCSTDWSAAVPRGPRAWLRELPIDGNSVRAITRTYDEQVAYAGAESVSTPSRLAVEEVLDRDAYKRRFHVHATYGRRFNEGLSRLVAAECAARTDADPTVAVADRGFSLSRPVEPQGRRSGVIRELDPETVREDLRAALRGPTSSATSGSTRRARS